MRYIEIRGDGEHSIECSLTDFTLRLPYLISKKDRLIPPDLVIRDVYSAGELNAGMSGLFRWENMYLTDRELKEINTALESDGYTKAATPEWVMDRNTWGIWKLEYVNGVPAEEHRELYSVVKGIEEKILHLNGEDESKQELYEAELLRAEMNLADFVNRHL